MDKDLNAFFEVARTQLREPLDRDFETDLVRRVAAEARVSAAATPTVRTRPARPRRRLVLPARIAIVAGAVVLGTAGLAVAGVNLPGPVGSAFETVGVDLPNQAPDHASPPSGAKGSDTENGEPAPKGTNGNHKAKGHEKAKKNGKGHAYGRGHAKGEGAQSPNASAQGQASSSAGGANGRSESAPGHTTSPSPSRGTIRIHPVHPLKPLSPGRGK